MVRLAIQTVLLPGDDLAAKLAAARRFGFDAVEVVAGPAFDPVARLDEVRRASAEAALPVAAICTHPIHDPLLPDPIERRQRLALLRDLLAGADELGAEGVVSVPVRPPHRFLGLDDRTLSDLAVETFGELAAGLPAGRARLFLEPLNRYEAFFLNRVGQAIDLCRRIGHTRVAALADLFHMNIEEASLSVPLTEAGPFLGYVHVADNNRLQPGAGCLDFASPLAALKAIGYAGFLSIECYSPEGPRIAGDPETALPATVRFLRRAWDAAGTPDSGGKEVREPRV